MPSFDFITLLWWGLPLAAAPIVIHLINLLRHRVVRWPAIEFSACKPAKISYTHSLKATSALIASSFSDRGPCPALRTTSLGDKFGQHTWQQPNAARCAA